jgi:uncharacterized ParB-like nuclease family protein
VKDRAAKEDRARAKKSSPARRQEITRKVAGRWKNREKKTKTARIKTLPLDKIRVDFQPAENHDDEKVQEYVLRIQQGKALPPIIVRFDGANYWCQDGFHRIEASRQMGRAEIRAEVLPGTLAEMEAEYDKYVQAVKKSLQRSPQ